MGRLSAEEANENAASPFTVPISAASRYGEVFITPDPYGSGYKLTYLKGEETLDCITLRLMRLIERNRRNIIKEKQRKIKELMNIKKQDLEMKQLRQWQQSYFF